MVGAFQKLLNRAASRLAVDLGYARRYFAAQRGRIRILTYHGIAPDELADAPWLPSQAVTVSQFERQMAMLAELGSAPRLGDALDEMRADEETPTAVCITFDDGLADNATLALPILREYGHAATFFLTTGYIGPDQHLPNDMLRLLRPLHESGTLGEVGETLHRILSEPGWAKTQRFGSYAAQLAELWAKWKDQVDPAGRHALQMMTWKQVHELQQAGMEIGAHTVHHVILGCEGRRTRRNEIVDAVARVRAETGEGAVPFAYPNGLEGDYEAYDTDLLAAIDVSCAVTESTGWNDRGTPVLELHRQCIGRHCSDRAFLAKVYGVEEALSSKL